MFVALTALAGKKHAKECITKHIKTIADDNSFSSQIVVGAGDYSIEMLCQQHLHDPAAQIDITRVWLNLSRKMFETIFNENIGITSFEKQYVLNS